MRAPAPRGGRRLRSCRRWTPREFGANIIRRGKRSGCSPGRPCRRRRQSPGRGPADGPARRLRPRLAGFDQLGESVAGDAGDVRAARRTHPTTRAIEVAVEGPRRGEDDDLLRRRWPPPQASRPAPCPRTGTGEGIRAGPAMAAAEAVLQATTMSLTSALEEARARSRRRACAPPRRAGAIGKEGGVGEVDDALAGREPAQVAKDAQPADPGIEHADGTRIHRFEG